MPTPASPSRAPRYIALALAIVTLALYGQVRGHGFILLDDPDYVRLNSVVRQGLNGEGVRWALTTGHASNWHPVTWVSHMLDVSLFGVHPGGMHLVNALLHTANSVLLFFLFLRLTGGLWPSAFAAAMFAWHPLHVESVAWIAERKDVLSTLFFLLTLWAYAGYAARPGILRYLGVAAFLALGLMAKPMLVTTPCVLLLLDAWPLRRAHAKRDWLRLGAEKLPLFALAAASCVATFLAQRASSAVVSTSVFPLKVRVANAIVAYAQYLLETVWPLKLAVFYPHPGMRPGWQIALAVLVLGAISGLVIWQRRLRPYGWVGWLWFLGTLVPVIGLVQVGDQALADRYTYLPLIGVSVMLAWAGSELAARREWGAPVAVVGLGAAGVWLTLTTLQLRHWQNNETLFTHARAVTQGNYLADSVVGSMLLSRGQFEGARQCFGSALQVRPTYAKALSGMGEVLAAEGRTAESLKYFEQALRWSPQLSDTHNAYGAALAALERWDEALLHFTDAVRLEPGFAEAEFNRAVILRKVGWLEEAAEAFRRAGVWGPGNVPAQLGLADVRLAQQRDREALDVLEPLLRANPNEVEALHRVAWIQSTSTNAAVRQGDEAVILGVRACELTGQGHAASLAALAAAYAERGRFADALRLTGKAESAAGKQGDKELAERLHRMRAVFEAQQAFRRP